MKNEMKVMFKDELGYGAFLGEDDKEYLFNYDKEGNEYVFENSTDNQSCFKVIEVIYDEDEANAIGVRFLANPLTFQEAGLE